MTVRIGARRSPLARAQADWVAARLREAGIDTEYVGIDTRGDVDRRHLTEIGGTGVFATAVRDQLRDGVVDLAVHSLKDLPTDPAPGLTVAATPTREDTRDVLIGARRAELGPGARIGTGSTRRFVQLAQLEPEWEFVPIRGNVDTRLDMVRSGDVHAIVLAAAGLRRLGYWHDDVVGGLPAVAFSLSDMLPAPGQGALGLEIRADDDRTARIVARIDDLDTHLATDCERSFLNELGSGCLAPVGVAASVETRNDGGKVLSAVARLGDSESVSGVRPSRLVEVSDEAPASAASELGRRMAREALALLGGRERRGKRNL